MSLLRDIYQRHLDSTCSTGYDPRTVKVPFNGNIYVFHFDKPNTPLAPNEMLEGIRTMEVNTTMILPEAWKILSGLNESRYHCKNFFFSETQKSGNWQRIEKNLKAKPTNEGNHYSADRALMGQLVKEWIIVALKDSSLQEPHERAIDRIWVQEDSPAQICTPASSTGFNYEFQTGTRGTLGHIIEFLGDLETAILAPRKI